jgi:hypothetical protein
VRRAAGIGLRSRVPCIARGRRLTACEQHSRRRQSATASEPSVRPPTLFTAYPRQEKGRARWLRGCLHGGTLRESSRGGGRPRPRTKPRAASALRCGRKSLTLAGRPRPGPFTTAERASLHEPTGFARDSAVLQRRPGRPGRRWTPSKRLGMPPRRR